jgi:hypothetical protein
MKKFFAVASAVLLAMSIPLQANASNFSTSGWQTGFTVTTTSEGLDGSGNYVMTVTYDHTAATFVNNSGIPTASGTLKVFGYRLMQCDTATYSYTLNDSSLPSGCLYAWSGPPSTATGTISGNGEVLTVVFTLAAAQYAAITKPFLVPEVMFKDANNAELIVPSGGSSVGSSSGDSSGDEVPPPVYFGGPLVMGSTLPHFTQGEEGTVTLTGKRMNKITSATINGVAVTVTADRRSATITVPATLAAGTYDLVLQTTNGRLTVMRFIKVS